MVEHSTFIFEENFIQYKIEIRQTTAVNNMLNLDWTHMSSFKNRSSPNINSGTDHGLE